MTVVIALASVDSQRMRRMKAGERDIGRHPALPRESAVWNGGTVERLKGEAPL
jgi:hypothetical protein